MKDTTNIKEIQLQCAEIMNKVGEEHDIPKSIAYDDLSDASPTVTAAWCLMYKEEQKNRVFDLYGEAHTDLNGIQDYPSWLEATVMEALQAVPIVYEPEPTEPESTGPTRFKAAKVTYTKNERQRLAEKFVILAKEKKLPEKISYNGWTPIIQFIADHIEKDYPEACRMLLFSYHRFNVAGEGLSNVYEWIANSMIEDQEDLIMPPSGYVDSCVMTADPQSDTDAGEEDSSSTAMSREEFIKALFIE